MYLLLSHENDPVAAWMMQGLSTLLPEELIWITDADFARARRFELRLGNNINEARLALADGRRIDSSNTYGVINRLFRALGSHLAYMRAEDRDYAWQEMAAFTLGWLSAFSCPVINAPAPNSFSGRMRSPLEWDCLARRAGLPVSAHSWSSRLSEASVAGAASMWSPPVEPDQPTASVFVVGSRIIPTSVAPFLDTRLIDEGLLALATLADMPLFEVVFARGCGGEWVFCRVEPMPDLRRADHDGMYALRDLLATDSSPTQVHSAS